MLVEIKALQRPIPHSNKNISDMGLSELLSKTPQWRSRRNLRKEHGAILHARRKERGVTLTELSGKTGIRRDDIELAERGLLELSEDQKLRIKKFLRRQCIL